MVDLNLFIKYNMKLVIVVLMLNLLGSINSEDCQLQCGDVQITYDV